MSTIERLASYLRDHPEELEQLLEVLKVPIHQCEGYFSLCQNLTAKTTQNPFDFSREYAFCKSCRKLCISDYEAQHMELVEESLDPLDKFCT